MTDSTQNSDFFIAERLRKNIIDESRIKRAKAFAYLLCAFGIFLILTSIGLYISSIGYSMISDLSPVERKIGIMIADAIKKMEITTEISGSVNLNSNPLLLDSSSKIGIDKNSAVRISPDSTVTINGNIRVIQPKPSSEQLDLKAVSKGGVSPITDYIIFRDINFGNGQVETKYVYNIDTPERPRVQICGYYQTITSTKSISFNVGKDGIKEDGKSAAKLGLNIDELFKYCQWI